MLRPSRESPYNMVILINNVVYRNLRHHTAFMVVHLDRLSLYLQLIGMGSLEGAVLWEHGGIASPGLRTHLITSGLFGKPLS
jgi:hypothetical protein